MRANTENITVMSTGRVAEERTYQELAIRNVNVHAFKGDVGHITEDSEIDSVHEGSKKPEGNERSSASPTVDISPEDELDDTSDRNAYCTSSPSL